MLDRSEVGKRGYLDRDFRLVHLKDSLAQKIDYHYHEFDKLVIFLGGKVTYVVEGVTYFLKPWDIVLIQHNLIHRPIIHADGALRAGGDVAGTGLAGAAQRSRRAAGRLSGQAAGSGGSTCCGPRRSGGLATSGPSSSWRRPCGPRSSAPPVWRIRCASSC